MHDVSQGTAARVCLAELHESVIDRLQQGLIAVLSLGWHRQVQPTQRVVACGARHFHGIHGRFGGDRWRHMVPVGLEVGLVGVSQEDHQRGREQQAILVAADALERAVDVLGKHGVCGRIETLEVVGRLRIV
eukprot:5441181-Prymnesium_polylepis.1